MPTEVLVPSLSNVKPVRLTMMVRRIVKTGATYGSTSARGMRRPGFRILTRIGAGVSLRWGARVASGNGVWGRPRMWSRAVVYDSPVFSIRSRTRRLRCFCLVTVRSIGGTVAAHPSPAGAHHDAVPERIERVRGDGSPLPLLRPCQGGTAEVWRGPPPQKHYAACGLPASRYVRRNERRPRGVGSGEGLDKSGARKAVIDGDRTITPSRTVLCWPIVSLALVVMACSGDTDPSQSLVIAEESDSAGIALVQITGEVADLPLWPLSDDPVAEVRGDVAPFFGGIGQVALLGDGQVVIEDAQIETLYLFARDGAAFRTMGQEGDGPGEFRAISTVSVTSGDTVHVFDRRHNRMSVFSPDGDLMRSVPMDASITSEGVIPRRAWALESGRMVAQGTSPLTITVEPESAVRDQRDVLVFALDRSGHAQAPALRFQGGYTIRGMIRGQGIIIVAPFANVPIIAAGQDQVVHGSGVTYELVVASADLRPARIIRWPGWASPLTDARLMSARAEAASQFKETFPEQADLIVDAMFSEELLPTTLPALGAAQVDDQGRIWVRRFQPSTARWNQPDSWHVLDALGVPLARVRLPDRTRLAAVRGDEVAVIYRDELDVEHLRVYAFERNAAR